eukprot:CAMPEP_0177637624 /NCGR_PEP_ID=MMETSP0447-20121125/5066_1 /TAXON_ID=0 /ORGANISM="Stygamoeba regulata, Strain BSH-02190019" /LENGTH=238 /DNA_ID=CAMNT_0019139555 /DNA_START=179 /DNA_END=895 /DNA_ORIENTATION=+
MLARTALRLGKTAQAATALPGASVSKRTLFTLPPLPYAVEKGLAPAISPKALDIHYNRHHNTYVQNLNRFVAGTEFEHFGNANLPEIIQKSAANPDMRPIFNNAAQVYNHSFFFDGLSPSVAHAHPSKELSDLFDSYFDGLSKFKQQFTGNAIAVFGSGWTWLVDDDGDLKIINTSNADNPLLKGDKVTPLLTLDVWEHSYYLDFQNKRPEYVENFWNVVNWEFVAANLEIAKSKRNQ